MHGKLHKPRKSSMIVFMGRLSVAEAAKRLGVGVPRVHQRISDGSLRAERIGAQWVVDELSLLRVAESKSPGRPLSSRSAWALIALADGDDDALAGLAPAERARARERLNQLFAKVAGPLNSEEQLRDVAVLLRSWFRNRAERRLYRATAGDLPALREDRRLALSGLSAASGIASGDVVEGYVASDVADRVVADYLLVSAEHESNVVLHVVSPEYPVDAGALLLLAADLAEHRGPREELRAAEYLREASQRHQGVEQ